MSESLQQIPSNSDGSTKSLDDNGDMISKIPVEAFYYGPPEGRHALPDHPKLAKVWDADAITPEQLELYRDELRISTTSESMRKHVLDSQPQQLSF